MKQAILFVPRLILTVAAVAIVVPVVFFGITALEVWLAVTW